MLSSILIWLQKKIIHLQQQDASTVVFPPKDSRFLLKKTEELRSRGFPTLQASALILQSEPSRQQPEA